MPSRLSSLLVRDGLVSVKRMELAFQRQVIYGGCLDTILLEMSLVPEERLLQYLALTTGLPPATRSETDGVDAEAARTCPIELARMYHVVPLCFEKGALRVLVHDPIELALLEDLANELGVPVQPLVVPEYRFRVVFARVFGNTPEARFVNLAQRNDEEAVTLPVGKAASVIVNGLANGSDNDAAQEPAPDSGRSKRTQEMATAALARRLAEEAAEATGEADGASASSASTTLGMGPGLLPSADSATEAEIAHRATAAGTAVASSTSDSELGRQDTTPLNQLTPARARARAETPPLGVADTQPAPTYAAAVEAAVQSSAAGAEQARAVDIAPLAPDQATPALVSAEDRDLVFLILLRALRHRTGYAALLTVQGAAAVGRVALVGDDLDRDRIAKVLIPLDVPSPFRTVVRAGAPHLGPVITGDKRVDPMLERMGNARAGLLVPIVLRDRVVAVGFAHNGADPIEVVALSEILPLAELAAESLSRVIVRSKARGHQRGATAAPAEDPAPASGDRRPTRSTEEMLPPIDSVLSAVESDDPVLAHKAVAEAIERTDETVAALAERFPGALLIERYELEGRQINAAQHGPLLALVTRLGPAATELLLDKMQAPQRDVRYYATLCAVELRSPQGIRALIERLFDDDYGIRSVAIAGLSGYPAEVLDPELVTLRQALHSDQPDRAQAAANALAKLDDLGAIPDLIASLGHPPHSAEPARRALMRLTMQDFGTAERKWHDWWTKNRNKHRVEWLIDGLAHRDDNLRRAAVEELRQLTGEYFGFHHDLAKNERELARQRWLEWWERTGRTRFAATHASGHNSAD